MVSSRRTPARRRVRAQKSCFSDREGSSSRSQQPVVSEIELAAAPGAPVLGLVRPRGRGSPESGWAFPIEAAVKDGMSPARIVDDKGR